MSESKDSKLFDKYCSILADYIKKLPDLTNTVVECHEAGKVADLGDALLELMDISIKALGVATHVHAMGLFASQLDLRDKKGPNREKWGFGRAWDALEEGGEA
jgi:hypothetical protein